MGRQTSAEWGNPAIFEQNASILDGADDCCITSNKSLTCLQLVFTSNWSIFRHAFALRGLVSVSWAFCVDYNALLVVHARNEWMYECNTCTIPVAIIGFFSWRFTGWKRLSRLCPTRLQEAQCAPPANRWAISTPLSPGNDDPDGPRRYALCIMDYLFIYLFIYLRTQHSKQYKIEDTIKAAKF